MSIDLDRRPHERATIHRSTGSITSDWDQRATRSSFPGQYWISAPLRGDRAPAGANATLTRKLDQLWVERSGTLGPGPNITSVVAVIQDGASAERGEHQSLTLIVTADNVNLDEGIDGKAMGRQVDLALEQLSNESGYTPRPWTARR